MGLTSDTLDLSYKLKSEFFPQEGKGCLKEIFSGCDLMPARDSGRVWKWNEDGRVTMIGLVEALADHILKGKLLR